MLQAASIERRESKAVTELSFLCRQLRNKCPSALMHWAETCGDEMDTDH